MIVLRSDSFGGLSRGIYRSRVAPDRLAPSFRNTGIGETSSRAYSRHDQDVRSFLVQSRLDDGAVQNQANDIFVGKTQIVSAEEPVTK